MGLSTGLNEKKKPSFWFQDPDKPQAYHTCTFQGLGKNTREYLKLVAERMVEEGFKPAEKWREIIIAFNKSDLVYETSDEKFLLGIRAVSDGNLRVGYATTVGKKEKVLKILVGSYAFGAVFGILLALIVQSIVYPVPYWIAVAIGLLMIFLMHFPAFLYFWPSKMSSGRKVRQVLVGIAESMGSKQIKPFSSYLKLTTVDLEDR